MLKIKFKATRKVSTSCNIYRQINKRGNLEYDICSSSNDIIHILLKKNIPEHASIIIDCDKKTGEFTLRFDNFIAEKIT